MVLTQADIATLKKVGINMLILIGVTITLIIVSILIGI
jgi:hypothetical protein